MPEFNLPFGGVVEAFAVVLLFFVLFAGIRKAVIIRSKKDAREEGFEEIPKIIYQENIIEHFDLVLASPSKDIRRAFEAGLQLYRKNQFRKALLYFELTLRKNPSKEERAGIYNTMGICNIFLEHYTVAKGYFEQALGLTKSKRLEAALKGNIGIVYKHKKKFDDAMKFFHEAFDIYNSLNDVHGKIVQLDNMGAVFKKRGNPAEAVNCYEEALSIYRGTDITMRRPSAYEDAASIHKGKPEEALAYLRDGLEIFRKMGNKQSEAKQLENIGTVYSSMGNLEKAVEYYDSAFQVYMEMNDRQGAAVELENIGAVYKNKGEYGTALKYYEDSFKIYKQPAEKPPAEEKELPLINIKSVK